MATNTWTWMIYLATHGKPGDPALAFGDHSIELMRQAQIGGQVQVLVQQDTAATGGVRRIIGATLEIVSSLGEIDSGDPQTLIDFISWAKQVAPAERYALVLWSHGSGWEPNEMAQLVQGQSVKEPVSPGEFIQRGPEDEGRQVFFSSTVRRLLSEDTPPERAIAMDNGSGHSLDAIELGQVAQAARQILGQPLDLFGMNACQMSNVEVVCQLEDNVVVYVASQEDMPATSWPYDDILTRLVVTPSMDAVTLGQMIVARYCAYYRSATSLPWGRNFPHGATLAAVRPNQITPLVEAVKTLSEALRHDIDSQLAAVWAVHRAAHKFKFRLYDLASFCRALAAQPNAAPASVQVAQDVLNALANPMFLLAEEHTSSFYDDVGGLTTYLMEPGRGRVLSLYYDQTTYARIAGWGEFLRAYHAAAA
jgi:hypothetical protein